MIRLLLVEDQPSVRKGLQMLLVSEPDLCVIAEAPDGAAALDLAARLRPDIVVMDVDMPRLDGIATASSLRRVCPQMGIILLSLHNDARTQAHAAEMGTAACVAKSLPADTLVTAIRQVAYQRGNGLIVPASPST